MKLTNTTINKFYDRTLQSQFLEGSTDSDEEQVTSFGQTMLISGAVALLIFTILCAFYCCQKNCKNYIMDVDNYEKWADIFEQSNRLESDFRRISMVHDLGQIRLNSADTKVTLNRLLDERKQQDFFQTPFGQSNAIVNRFFDSFDSELEEDVDKNKSNKRGRLPRASVDTTASSFNKNFDRTKQNRRRANNF